MRLHGEVATLRACKIPLLCFPSSLLVLGSVVLWCVTVDAETVPTRTVSGQLVAGINDLARTLGTHLDKLPAAASAKSDIISPVSIGTVLLLLLRMANQTLRNELYALLHLDQRTKAQITPNFRRLIKEFTDDIGGKGILDELPEWHQKRHCLYGVPDDYDYDDDSFLPEPPQPNVVQLANGIFIQSGFLQNTTEIGKIANHYKARIEKVNFRDQPTIARDTINQWVNESTRGRIEQILHDNLPANTHLVVASALYFKASWETFFYDPVYTRQRPFFPGGLDKPSVQVPIMAATGCFPYYASPEHEASIMAFPYRNRTTSMYIILPNGSNRQRVRDLRAKLGPTELDHLIGQMKRQKAMVSLPRMQLNNHYNLRGSLEALGLQSLFDARRNNFKIGQTRTPPTNLYVDSMVHQINLSVNEHGTEGGAVTMAITERSMPPVNFSVRGPFLLAIRHDPTKMLLFYGAVYDPS